MMFDILSRYSDFLKQAGKHIKFITNIYFNTHSLIVYTYVRTYIHTHVHTYMHKYYVYIDCVCVHVCMVHGHTHSEKIIKNRIECICCWLAFSFSKSMQVAKCSLKILIATFVRLLTPFSGFYFTYNRPPIFSIFCQ